MRTNGMEGGVRLPSNVGGSDGGEGEDMSGLETLELEPLAMNEWMGRAACKGMVSELWDDNVPEPDALRVCFRCPVQRECLDYGLRRPFASDAGVLGGTGVYDRQRLRAGKVTVREVLMGNLRRLVIADHGFALGIEAESLQPRLRLVP
jgi:hypothetical protein